MVKQYCILEKHYCHFTDFNKKTVKYESLFSLWEIPCINIIIIYVFFFFYVGLMISFDFYDSFVVLGHFCLTLNHHRTFEYI